MSIRQQKAGMTKVQFWISHAEKEGFDLWCKARNASRNKVLLAMIRERMRATGASPEMTIQTPSGKTSPARTRQRGRGLRSLETPDLETRLRQELMREGDPYLAARVKQLLDRAKTSSGT
jgi:hypothetical protein